VVVLRGLKDVSWAGAKSMMAEGNFLRSLVEFDKDAVSEKQVKKVKEYMKVGGGYKSQVCCVRTCCILQCADRQREASSLAGKATFAIGEGFGPQREA
jgi:hypothetical protein